MKGIDRFSTMRGVLARAFVVFGMLALTACGGGYGGGGKNHQPTVTLSAAPTTITLGQSTTLTWTSSVGTTCTASGGWTGAKAVSGSESVTPTAVRHRDLHARVHRRHVQRQRFGVDVGDGEPGRAASPRPRS